jgi:DNA-binding NarL/FixJ family response regulator
VEGVEHLERAVEVLAASPYRWNQANAEVDLGKVLIDVGRTEDARGVLASALEYAFANDARPIARRAGEQLARIGVKVPAPLRLVTQSLSATEERIARLAASGLSDTEIAQRLFVTTRTVQVQLGETFSKLGIESRDDLASALAGTSAP